MSIYVYLYMLCCVSCLPNPTHPFLKEAAFGRLHNSGAGAFGARTIVVKSFMDGCVGAVEAAGTAEYQ